MDLGLLSLGGLGLSVAGLLIFLWWENRRLRRSYWRSVLEYFTPPHLADEDAARAARLLAFVVYAVAGIAGVLTVVAFAISTEAQRTIRLTVGSFLLAILIWLFYFLRRGQVRWVCLLLPSTLWLFATAAIINFGGLDSPIISAYFPVIVLAALASGWQAAV